MGLPIVNPLVVSEKCFEVRGNGSIILRLGPWRIRYGAETGNMFCEYLYRGKWYVEDVDPAAFVQSKIRSGEYELSDEQ